MDEIKEYGFRGLANLSAARENRDRVFATPGVAVVMLDACISAEAAEIREPALMGVAYLSATPENATRFYEMTGLVASLVQAATEGTTNGIRESGLLGLANLSASSEYQLRLFDTPGVVCAMVQASTCGETNNLISYGLLGLSHFACTADLNHRLVNTPGIVNAYLQAVLVGGTDITGPDGCSGLANLTSCTAIADAMVRDFDLLNILSSEQPNDGIILAFLHLVTAPYARSLMNTGTSLIDNLVQFSHQTPYDTASVRLRKLALAIGTDSRDTNSKVVRPENKIHYAKLVLAICAGSSGTNREFLKPRNSVIQTAVRMLNSAIANQPTSEISWKIPQPLLALRYLSTVEENRMLLGTDWLYDLPLAIDISLKTDEVASAECVVTCLLSYAGDGAFIDVLHLLIEAMDRWVVFFGVRGLIGYEKMFDDVLAVLAGSSALVCPRTRDEIDKIRQVSLFATVDDVDVAEQEKE